MARILLLDDEPRLLRSVRKLLEHAGHEVRAAPSFAEADQWIHPGHFDVLLTDIFMPEGSGLEVLETAMERGCSEPVILITGEPQVKTASEAVRKGAFDYVPKPLTKENLLEVVDRAMRHVEVVRERDRARESELQLLRGFAAIGESASILAHEMRTPLTNLNAALRAVGDQLGIEHRAVLEELVEPLERMKTMMNRTLTFARPLTLNLTRCQLSELFETAVRELDGRQNLTIDVHHGNLPPATVDRPLLEEVLINLLQNAADAAGEAGKARITAKSTTKDRIQIRVDDDGSGIPDDQREEVFQLFHTTKKSGTGIGLAFCRKIIHTHRGTIDLTESELGGACFQIELPPESQPAGSA